MKLWALLKDSYREVLDRKIFLVMLILSGLLTLFVASISYRMITLQDELQASTSRLNFFMGMDPHLGKPNYAIENFRQTNEPAEPWRGDYEFDWVVTAKDADALKRIPLTKASQLKRQFSRDEISYLDNIAVTENKATEPNQVRFTVTTHGTKVDDALGWRYEPKILFAIPLSMFPTSMRGAVYFIEDTLVNGLGAWLAVLIGVIVTASFIPNMLQKGAVDLMLSKPINRPRLLLNKYLGGLVFAFLLTAFTVVCIWFVIGLRSGIWSTGFLMVIVTVTFYFAVLYSVSTLMAVLTRSTVVAILVTLFVGVLLWFNGWSHHQLDSFRSERAKALEKIRTAVNAPKPAEDPDDPFEPKTVDPSIVPDWPRWLYAVSDTAYKVLPRTRDIDSLSTEWVAEGVLNQSDIKVMKSRNENQPSRVETFGVTVAFIAVLLGFACWKFTRTDY